MGRAHKLTPLQVKNLSEPGTYGDGAGLMLKVTPGGSKSWIHRYMVAGRDRWAGLGPYPDVSLADARELAGENRRKLRQGIDPLAEKHEALATLKANRARAKIFKECSKQYIDAHKASWSNPKHGDQWTNTLATYADPIIGDLDVSKIETAHVMKILEAIWATKTETATRVRGRIENILDWATVRKYRTGENPARWKGHLDTLLPAPSRVKPVEHHPALPFKDMPAFMKELRQASGSGARALEFAILTAARSGEVRLATWEEFDFEDGIWTVPAKRMKMRREHRVPLSTAALALLRNLPRANGNPYVFLGGKKDKPLSDMALTKLIRRFNEGEQGPRWTDPKSEGAEVVPHGFRSTFRDWVGETTDYPGDMAEMAIAHVVEDATEAAYRRGTMFEKRRAMMQDWANYCG